MKGAWSRPAFACLTAIGVLAAVEWAWGQEGAEVKPTSPETIWVKAYLDDPSPQRLALALEAAERTSGDRQSQTEVRDFLERKFKARWIAGPAGSWRFTMDDFSQLGAASQCEPFGPKQSGLVKLLVDHPLPKAKFDRTFLRWLQDNLPPTVNGARTSATLLAAMPKGAAGQLQRYAFLLEAVGQDDVAGVRAALHGRLQTTTSAEMRESWRELKNLGRLGDLARWSTDADTKTGLRLLGDRLFSLPPEDWTDSGEAFRPLVEASSHQPHEFLRKCTAKAQENPDAASRSQGDVLEPLLEMVPAQDGYTILEPGKSLDWFLALHKRSLIQKLHARQSSLIGKSYSLVLRFDGQGHFTRLFPYLSDHYYAQDGYRQQVFDDLLRPRARDKHTALVLGAALKGKFLREHRAILAQDNLRDGRAKGGSGLAPAWPATTSSRHQEPPSRLGAATQIFRDLAQPRKDPLSLLAELLNAPLLDDIVDESLRLLRSGDKPLEATLTLLRPLAERIKEYRSAGADTSKSGPLQRLEREIAADVDRALEALPERAAVGAASSPETRAAIRRFVATVALAFRLRGLMEQALGNMPDWTARARRGLRQRVFGLEEGTSQPQNAAPDAPAAAVYWDAATTEFRAEMLNELDVPLRECLSLDDSGKDRHAFWEEIYLPLVRCHGLVKVLRRLGGDKSWPHLAWAVSGSKDEQSARLKDLFAALRTDRWLDADNAVEQLATEYQTRVLGADVWLLDPAKQFAGHWGVNANFLIWKRMLDKSTPPSGGDWKLAAIARRAVVELGRGVLPIGPTFPLSGDRPAADPSRDPWDFVPWAINVITAAEWRQSPFADAQGVRLPEPQFSVTSSPESRFHFELALQAAARQKVDGQLRSELCEMLMQRIARQSAVSSAAPLERLVPVAEAVMMLPNHADNVAVPSGAAADPLQRFCSQRQQIYGRLHEALVRITDRSSRATLLRAMMRLDVSRRQFGSLDPSFETVEKLAEGWANNDALLRYELDGIRAERAELLELIHGKPPDSLELKREYVDAKIKAILPQELPKEDRILWYRDYKERLAALDDARVLYVLKIRKPLRDIIKQVASSREAAAGQGARDLDRVLQMLSLVDYTIFFGRRDFRADNYLSPLAANDEQGKPRTWRPALVVLAWLDAELQQQALTLCDHLEPGADEVTQQRIAETRFGIFTLNESIFATIERIAARDDAKAIFDDFRPHKIEWKTIHFRLLANTKVSEDASAESLSRDCFRGVLNNLAIATARRAPNDEDVQNRLFGSLGYCWPEEQRRNTIRLNIDGVVRLADQWIDRPQTPEALKAGATAFLAEGHKNLLANAASVQGVLGPMSEILTRSRGSKATPRYRDFFDRYLTSASQGSVVLSAELEGSLASPFFRGQTARQRQDVEGMLDFWRGELGRGAPGPGAAGAELACRGDFGRIVSRLVQGVGRPKTANYLFEAADRLVAESGPRREPPKEFFDLVRWWMGTAKRDDPPEIQRLYDTRTETQPTSTQAERKGGRP